jgi:hypothetical protein
MCPTFLRSVRPGSGTSDDLLSVYDRSDAKGGSRLCGQSLFCGCGRPLVPDYLVSRMIPDRCQPFGSYPQVLPSIPSIARQTFP